MSKSFVPYQGYHHAKQIQDAFSSWLSTIEADWSVTLNFNRPITIPGARNQLKAWLARVDRSLLGPRWYKKSSSKRTSGVATIENPNRNTHLHLLLKLPQKAAELSRSTILTAIYDSWKTLEPQGQIDLQRIWDINGVAKYNCKQLIRRDYLDNCLIIFSEFHSR